MHTVTGIVPNSRIPNGCTKPYYLLCDDGEQYAVKFKENPESCRVLINEFVCAELAQLLDLPLAEPKFIYLDESFVEDHGAQISVHVGEEITTGTHFGTQKVKKAFQIFNSQMIEEAVNINCVPEIILFDHLICNKDRDSNGGNLLFDHNTKQIVLIDHTHAFDLGPLWNAIELKRRVNEPFFALNAHGFVYKKLVPFVRGNNPFATILDKMLSLNDDDLWHIINNIPSEWHITPEEKEALLEYLSDRLNRIEQVLPCIKPTLPYWKGGN
jgi:hypothetical protein